MSLKIGGKLGVTLLSLPFLLYQTSSILADPVPSDRRINWQGQIGVPGGIPNRTTIYQTISSSLGNGTSDAQPAINGAVNGCPDNQVIKLPDGVFLLNAMVRPSPPIKSNFTIRGNGPGRRSLRSTTEPLPSTLEVPTGLTAQQRILRLLQAELRPAAVL